jgi:hypothetical protein
VGRTGHSLTWRTAMALHKALKTGHRPNAREVREAIEQAGGEPRYIAPAAKWLRDHGIAVATQKRRHLSIWYEAKTADQMTDYGKQVVAESYSELVTNARSCAILTGRGSRTARDKLIRAAVGLGEYLGHTAEEVVEECKPLHAAQVNGAQAAPARF